MFRAGGNDTCYRAQTLGIDRLNKYQPLIAHVGPRRNVAFCGSFPLMFVTTVDAVDIIPSLGEPLVCMYPSFQSHADAPSKRLPPPYASRREMPRAGLSA